ncbi:hypothetical protein KIN20_023941 [Parelaphostrongylus tenuis]|uniref:GPI ethanolamine phosphate transferase 1 n=1 Tax=Parelaphostrongylus tenuis TaxID=148309 RepID=A0AAD5MWD5_PARTN|nr:hypothetical protein KIN20_023941 [Parelaphostrongylus tenuis]
MALFLNVMIFVDRRFLAVVFIILSFVPNMYAEKVVQEWAKSWRTLCVILLPFPFFPNVGTFELPWLCVAAPVIFGTSLLHLSRHKMLKQKRDDLRRLSAPAFLRFLSWCSLPLSLIFPLFSSPIIFDRSMWFICSLFVPYSLLSIAYESFFILCFIPLLVMFLRFEFHHMSDVEFLRIPADRSLHLPGGAIRSGRVSGTELRIAAVCMSFVLVTLFGTGNFASMNSFNPSTLNRFISVFSPFTMAALLLFKLLIPLLMVSLLLSAVLRFDRKAVQRLSCIVLILTDLMAMCFFHQLKDEAV